MKQKSVGVGVLGLGVIAGQVARLLHEQEAAFSGKLGGPLMLRKIKVLPQDLERPLAKQLPAGLFTTDDDEFFATPGLDIVVEAIGGEHPALEYHQRALKAGKHVVTSNKELIAKHGLDLLALAHEHGVALQYEASVGGGIPLIAPFKHDLVANRVTAIYAIINGTTNYILTRMDREGIDFATALQQAQQLGYAEPDPTNDIEGYDARYKVAILASLAFRTAIRPEQVHCEGITKLSGRDFRYARDFGYAIKLLAIAKAGDGAIEARVHPVFLPAESQLAKVEGVYNAVQVEGDLVGRVMFTGQGAGAGATSSAVIADVIGSARKIALGVGSISGWRQPGSLAIRPMEDIETPYYVRLTAADRPGVLARIADIFGQNAISISSARQPESDEATRTAEIVIMTHPAVERAMRKARAELEGLEVVREVNNIIRVEEMEGEQE
jgi:homoserine dehydrogenase